MPDSRVSVALPAHTPAFQGQLEVVLQRTANSAMLKLPSLWHRSWPKRSPPQEPREIVAIARVNAH
jgi:hypothetical protein